MNDLYMKMVDDKWDAAVFETPEDPHNPFVYFAVTSKSEDYKYANEDAWGNLSLIGTNLVVYTGPPNLLALFAERVALWMPRLLQKSKGFLMFKVVEFSSGSGLDRFPGGCVRAVALSGTEGLKGGMRGVMDPLGREQEWYIRDIGGILNGLSTLLRSETLLSTALLRRQAEIAWRHYVLCRLLLRILYGGHKEVEVLVEGQRLKDVKVFEVTNSFTSPCLHASGKTELLSFAKPVEQGEIDHCISRIEVPIKFIPKKERFSRFLQEYVSAVTAIFTAENDRRFYWYWYIRSTVEKSYLYHISQIRYRLCKKIVNVWVKLRICLVMIYDELRLRQGIKSCAWAEWLDKLASLRACYSKRDPSLPATDLLLPQTNTVLSQHL
jgi:hypothetical protein